MLFSWDPIKAVSNLRKHGVSFEVALTVFDDPLHLSVCEERVSHEERWITVGRSIDYITLIVVHTYRMSSSKGEMIRIISARRATSRERREYEKGI